MLHNINLHLHPDAEIQRVNEQQAADQMARWQKENLNIFQRVMPNVYEQVVSSEGGSYSIMCNRNAELNIVDYAEGRVVYGQHPGQEIDAHVQQFLNTPHYVQICDYASDVEPVSPDLLSGVDSALAEKVRASTPLSESRAVVVMLGVGLGYQIKSLLEQTDIAHLIIYEPTLDFFKCSLLASNWRDIFNVARRKGTGLYLQLGKDGRDLYSDMSELAGNVDVNGFYLYRHYHHLVFDDLEAALASSTWKSFSDWTPKLASSASVSDYLNVWTPPVARSAWQYVNLDETRFEKNMAAFTRFFPKVAKAFTDYVPESWIPLANEQGEVNVFHAKTLETLHSDLPHTEGQQIFSNYAEHPNQNNLILGYKGQKLKRYQHYRFVGEVTPILDSIEESEGTLPDKIKSMIMFGLGVGYQLSPLLENHDIEKLFVCEPNRDFFYASLYAIDWAALLEKIDDSEGRLYLNIGDDGTHLIEDLLGQFHSLGSYLLASTYFYQGYYNARLNPAIAQLREQLRVIIAMGEYYDHARYAIAHTHWAVGNGTPFLLSDADKHLCAEDKDVPVFIIGNGPSLDNLFPTLTEYADRAIIVSCGTALQSLHRHGITPDFHAEIETNRATYDWAVRIGDPDYLKQIRLISCNGIHPDTSTLYHSLYLAFKEGESGTASITDLYKQLPYVSLRNAYPTVTNFAAEFIRQFGFAECYLFGTDMGFVSDDYHHSKSSGYYKDDGEELRDYSKFHNTQLQVEGNFRPKVFTKYEFKVSCNVLGDIFRQSRGAVYNLNDGAKIKGAQPLNAEQVLITSTPAQKATTLERMLSSCFQGLDVRDFAARFEQKYQQSSTLEGVRQLIDIAESEQEISLHPDAQISAYREVLIAAYKSQTSMLFFLMNGTLNFMNSALNKVQNVSDSKQREEALHILQPAWLAFLTQIQGELSNDPGAFDFVSSNVMQRKAVRLRQLADSTDGYAFQVVPETRRHLLTDVLPEDWETNTAYAETVTIQFYDRNNACLDPNLATLIVTRPDDLTHMLGKTSAAIVYLPGHFIEQHYSQVCNDQQRLRIAVEATLNRYKDCILLPKLVLDPEHQSVETHYELSMVEQYHVYDGSTYLLLCKTLLPDEDRVNMLGDRLRYVAKARASDFVRMERDMAQQQEKKEALRLALFEEVTDDRL